MAPRRILVVYGTTYGQTEKIARYIRDVLASDGHQVMLELADNWRHEWNAHGYDAIIVGASLIVGKHQKSVIRFVRENLATLNRIPSAFFSVSATAASKDPAALAELDRIVSSFIAESGWHPGIVERIAGAIAYTRYSLLVRLVMRWITKRNGGPLDTSRDHELTDWVQVRNFALRVAGLVKEARREVEATSWS